MYSGTLSPRIVLPPALPTPAAQRVDLVLRQLAPPAGLQRGVPQRPDCTAKQPLNRVPDPLEQLSHLVGLPLAHDHPPPRIHPGGGGAHELEGMRGHPLTFNDRAPL